jgi:hypothetical protein
VIVFPAMRRTLALVIASALGCGGAAPADRAPGQGPVASAPAPAAAPVRSAASTCPADTAELAAYLAVMERDPGGIFLQPGYDLPVRDDLPRTTERLAVPQLHLRAGATQYQGEDAGRISSLEKRLDATYVALQQSVEARGLPADDRIVLQIDRATPWSQVVDVVNAAAKIGFRHQLFVVARTPVTAAPPRTAIDDRLEPLLADAARAGDAVPALVTEVLAPCAPLAELQHQELGPDDDRGEHLLTHAPEALAACRCAADVASVRSLLWQIAGTRHPVAILELRVDARGEKIAHPRTATWGDVAGALTPGATVRLLSKGR